MEEKKKEVFSETFGNIFAIREMPFSAHALLVARNSRTAKSLKQVYETEFKDAMETRSDQLSTTLLSDYGDDSVQELVHLTLQVENCSTLLAKRLERARVGISFIEKSTRYVDFAKKNKRGEYPFYRGKELKEQYPEYFKMMVESNTRLFEKFAEWMPVLMEEIRRDTVFPADATDGVRDTVVRTQALDALRVVLPAGTLTNVGMVGNALALERLCLKLQSENLGEFVECGHNLKGLFTAECPQFFRRCDPTKSDFAKEFVEHQKAKNEYKKVIVVNDTGRHMEHQKPFKVSSICSFGDMSEEHLYQFIINAAIAEGYNSSLSLVKNASYFDNAENIIRDIMHLDKRTNRRIMPPRAFEMVNFGVAITTDYKTWCDLERHRLLSVVSTILSVENGFVEPDLIKKSAIYEDYLTVMRDVADKYIHCYTNLAVPAETLQYMVPMGYITSWFWNVNLRELFHILELRTTPQGHPTYRAICQKIYRKFRDKYPFLASLMTFVNMDEDIIPRLDAEKKLEQRRMENATI